MTLLLSPDELRDLTGTKQAKRQAEPDVSWMLRPAAELAAERKAEGARRLAEVRAQKTANPEPVPPRLPSIDVKAVPRWCATTKASGAPPN